MKLYITSLVLAFICVLSGISRSTATGSTTAAKSNSKRLKKKEHSSNLMITKDIYMNSWAVRVVGDDNMAQKVAQENGFIYKGKVILSLIFFNLLCPSVGNFNSLKLKKSKRTFPSARLFFRLRLPVPPYPIVSIFLINASTVMTYKR